MVEVLTYDQTRKKERRKKKKVIGGGAGKGDMKEEGTPQRERGVKKPTTCTILIII